MKIKSVFAVCLALIICVSLFGCNSKGETLKTYDYNLDEYITLGQYKGVSYTPTEVTAVTEEDILNEINSAIESNNLLVTENITDRPAALGDTVNIDYEGLLDGVAFEGGTAQGYNLTLGSHSFIDGFEDGLVGATVGQSLSLNLTFPETYRNTDLAGKAVVFNITVNSISNTSYPELTDELVAKISDYNNVNDYKAYIQSYLESENKDYAKQADGNNIWETIMESTTAIKYPETEKQFYYDKLYESYNNYATQYGMTLEDFIGADNMENFIQYCNETAELTSKRDMIAVAIYRNENLKMTDDEYNTYSSYIITSRGASTEKEAIESLGNESIYYAQVIYLYVLNYVYENATAA